MIVVSGKALMDVFAAESTPTGVMLDARIGGSPLNVAIGLRRLAQPAAFIGTVSSGFLGDRLMKALVDETIDTRCSVRVDAPATLGLDGSCAMFVEPVAATQRALVEREHMRAVIAYDPNVRLNVESALQRWRDTLAWMLPRTHILKVSDEDLTLLFPGEDPAVLARGWLAQSVQLVVVTRGGEGAWAWTAGCHLSAAPVRVSVIDTVGAGDTFQAAILAALAERGLLSPAALRTLAEPAVREVLDFAARTAAITCSRRGEDLPRRHELV